MNFQESKLHMIFRYAYLILIGHFAFCINFVSGLGLFLNLSGFMVVFELFERIQDSTDIARVKLIPFIFERSKYYGRMFYKESIIMAIIMIILCLNFLMFMNSGHPFAFAGALISLIIMFVVFMMGMIFAYLCVHYRQITGIERWQNVISLTIVKAGELFLVLVCLVGILIVISQINIGLTVLLGFGIILLIYHIALSYLIKKEKGLFQNHTYWRHQDE